MTKKNGNDRRVGDCASERSGELSAAAKDTTMQSRCLAVSISTCRSLGRFHVWFLRVVRACAMRESAKSASVTSVMNDGIANDDDCWCGGRTVETTTAHLLRSFVLLIIADGNPNLSNNYLQTFPRS